MNRDVLEKQRIHGNEHPHTIAAMNNLAATLRYQGKRDDLAAINREVLEKIQQILGNEHPHTISTMNNLANTLEHPGKLE